MLPVAGAEPSGLRRSIHWFQASRFRGSRKPWVKERSHTSSISVPASDNGFSGATGDRHRECPWIARNRLFLNPTFAFLPKEADCVSQPSDKGSLIVRLFLRTHGTDLSTMKRRGLGISSIIIQGTMICFAYRGILQTTLQ